MFCAVHMLTLLHTEWVQAEVSVACAEHSPHSPHLLLTDWHRGVCMCAPSCAEGLRRTCWSVNSSSVTHLSCMSSLAEQLTVTLSKLWVMDIIKSASSSNPPRCDITNGTKTTALYCKLEPRDLYLHFFFILYLNLLFIQILVFFFFLFGNHKCFAQTYGQVMG